MIMVMIRLEIFNRTSERLQRGSVMFGRLDLGGGSKRNGDDRVLEELALDRRYLQVNTPEKCCFNLIGKFMQPKCNSHSP